MAKFISKCRNQVLCRKPNRIQVVDGVTVTVPGEHIRFKNGVYETSDKKEIAFLRNHRLNGPAFTEIREKERKLVGDLAPEGDPPDTVDRFAELSADLQKAWLKKLGIEGDDSNLDKRVALFADHLFASTE